MLDGAICRAAPLVWRLPMSSAIHRRFIGADLADALEALALVLLLELGALYQRVDRAKDRRALHALREGGARRGCERPKEIG